VNLGSSRVEFIFYHKAVAVFVFLSVATPLTTLYMRVGCHHLDWQVSSMAQIFNVLGLLFSNVVDLTLNYRSHTLSSEWHNQVDPTQWHKFLGSFRNVETVRVHDGLIGELSRCLALDREPLSEFLPKLKSLVCPIGSRDAKTFATFLHDREVAGLSVNLIEDMFPARRKMYNIQTASGVDRIR
jgi:mRNA-degrading endonuclease YafQ of YafQ-DinJ toxin-antitoxin module